MAAEDPLHWPLVTDYLAHAAAGRLVVPVCDSCGDTHFPPRVVCPHCLSDSVELHVSEGAGRVYSFTVVHVEYHPAWGSETPYVNALIDLDDGPVVFGNLVDCDPETVSVGASVTVDFEEIDGTKMPVFILD